MTWYYPHSEWALISVNITSIPHQQLDQTIPGPVLPDVLDCVKSTVQTD